MWKVNSVKSVKHQIRAKEDYKYLEILEVDTSKQVEIKEKCKKGRPQKNKKTS